MGLWEQLLLTRFGGVFPFNGPGNYFIHDGVWSANEFWATAQWQTEYKTITPTLVIDGYVGPQTWNTARFWNLTWSYTTPTGWDYYSYTDLSGLTLSMRRLISWDAWQTGPLLCPSNVLDVYRQVSHPEITVSWNSICSD